jgi:hypothetical protein
MGLGVSVTRNTSTPPGHLIETIYATCGQMPPSPAATHLNSESRAYIGELLLARAIVIIRALTPRRKLPAGAYDIDDPYGLTDLAELVNEFKRLDFANLPGKRGRKPAPKKAVRNYFLSLEWKKMLPRARRRGSKLLQEEMFMWGWEQAKSGLESQGKKALLSDIGRELARRHLQHEDLMRGQGPSAASLKECTKKNVEHYQKLRARMRKRKHRRDKNKEIKS